MSRDEIKSVLRKKFPQLQQKPWEKYADDKQEKPKAASQNIYDQFDDFPDAKKGAVNFDDLIPESIDMHLKKDAETTSALDSICDAQYPIFVTVTNNSQKVIEYVTFYISAKRAGRSTVVSDYKVYSSDLIIAPNQSGVGCVDVPLKSEYRHLDLKELEYEIKLENVTFKY